jgi:hypothetical protein
MITTFWDRYAADPDFAERVDEEARSIAESVGYVIRIPGPGARPEPCESCGTPVTACLEARSTSEPDIWRPAAWEIGPAPTWGARHTARRCAWLACHPAAADAA